MNRENKIVCFVPAISQPRVIKRISYLAENGYDIDVYGYSRGKYNCNQFPENIEVNLLGSLEDGTNYYGKLKVISKNVKSIKAKYPKGTLFYAFDFITALILCFCNDKFIYEISDLFYGSKKFDLIRFLCKFIDKKIISKSFLTIMTSEGFYDYFFKAKRKSNVIIQPNKLNSFFESVNRVEESIHSVKKSIVFSFVGALRYPNTIIRFARVIGQSYPMHHFYFYGEGNDSYMCKELADKYDNIKYFGSFVNPNDLEKIYSSIDVVLACYDTTSFNVRIAEPNKLYEAMFFSKPIIVSKKTFLSNQIDRYKCGYAIDAYDDDKIKEFVSFIDSVQLNAISNHEFNMDKDLLIDDMKPIIDFLSKL